MWIYGKRTQKIIRYVSTHWLSLESAVTRCLKLYPSLKSYFLSVDEKGNWKFDRLFGKFSDPMIEVYMYFYQFSLQPFIRFNLYIHREDSLISKLHAQIQRFLKDIACKFVKIRDVKNCRIISYLKYKDPSRQKEGMNCVIFQCDLTIYFIKALLQ